MDLSVKETLSKQTTNELKANVLNMSDGRSQDVIEASIAILKERGEDVDKLLRKAQVELCAKCSHRQQSKTGLVCDITGEKADFIGKCQKYICDEKAAKEQEQTKQEQSKWGGMMTLYWVLLMIGAAVTLVFGIFNYMDSRINRLLALGDLLTSVAYSVICIYTIIALSKKLPNAVAIGKIQNYSLIAINGLVLISYMVSPIGVLELSVIIRLVISLLIASVFLAYLYMDEQVKSFIPKESRHMLKYDKPILLLALGAIIGLYIAGFVKEGSAEQNMRVQELSSYVKNIQKSLKVDTSASEYIYGVEMSDGAVVIKFYYNTYQNSELDENLLNIQKIYTKEIYLFGGESIDKILLEKCYAADYGFELKTYDKNNEYSYSVFISPSEIHDLYYGIPHVTSKETWSNLLNEMNRQFPIDFGDISCTSAELRNDTAFYNYMIVDEAGVDLENITEDVMKVYLKENFASIMSDYFLLIAACNEMYIGFDYKSSALHNWNVKVVFSNDEINEMMNSYSY